jgi:hypothetical protein
VSTPNSVRRSIPHCFRCSQYRGSTVDFTSCLNLTNPQYTTPTHSKEPSSNRPRNGPKLSSGHLPHRPPPRSSPASGPRSPQLRFVLKLSVPTNYSLPTTLRPGAKVVIMTNPNHIRRGLSNGGPSLQGNHSTPPARPNGDLRDHPIPPHRGAASNSRRDNTPSRGGGGLSPGYRGRAFASGGRGSRPIRGHVHGIS